VKADMSVVAGSLPRQVAQFNKQTTNLETSVHDSSRLHACCDVAFDGQSLSATSVDPNAASQNTSASRIGDYENDFTVGGLQLPADFDWSTFTLVFIGDQSSRQFLNIMLRFLASRQQPQGYWVYHNNLLEDELDVSFQRMLNRRFYLVQKARAALVFGILIANFSDPRVQTVVTSLRKLLDDNGRTSYTISVGKVAPAKLANFAEIECFVMVACTEHALLENDREFHTPVLTPWELAIALNVTEWGEYSLDMNDYLKVTGPGLKMTNDIGQSGLSDDDHDAPYFSLVTGQYDSAPSKQSETIDLQFLPGQGQILKYKSVAADFLKSREYQGLEANLGTTQAQPAIPGQSGIASDYGK
jgi:diphthamide biosynthesis protein 2